MEEELEEELEEEFEEVEEIEEGEEVVEQLKSDSLKDMFPVIEDLKNKIKKGTEQEVAEICAIAGIEKTDSAMLDLCDIWRNS